jgi:hypothetical protein
VFLVFDGKFNNSCSFTRNPTFGFGRTCLSPVHTTTFFKGSRITILAAGEGYAKTNCYNDYHQNRKCEETISTLVASILYCHCHRFGKRKVIVRIFQYFLVPLLFGFGLLFFCPTVTFLEIFGWSIAQR